MKKLFTICAIFFAQSCFSQTYDSTMSGMKYAKITAVKAGFKDQRNSTRLGITVSDDDLSTRIILNVVLSDSLGIVYYRTPAIINGATYTAWNRKIDVLFNYVATQLGISLK